jgi:hypothetical protein
MARFSTTAAKFKVVLAVAGTLSLDTLKQNLDIVIALLGMWALYIGGLVVSTCLSRRERSKAWYDPHKYAVEATTLGFLENIDDGSEAWARMKDQARRKAQEDKEAHHLEREHRMRMSAKEIRRAASEKKEVAKGELKKISLVGAFRQYAKHGLSCCSELREEHPIVSFAMSRDVYFHDRHDKLTVVFCLLLGDMFIDALLYDGAGKGLPGLPNPNVSGSKMLLDFALGFVVDFIMIPVSIGILYVFSNVSTARQRDTIYTNLPHHQKLEWLAIATSVEMKEELRRANKRIEEEEEESKTSEGDAGNDSAALEALKDEALAVHKMVHDRLKLESRLKLRPHEAIKDTRERKRAAEDLLVSLHHMNGELAPTDIQARLQPIARYFYTRFLMPDESGYPKIALDLTRNVRMAYVTAMVWCVATSFYVFLYGICGAVQETGGEGSGEFECSGNGQESGVTRNWIASFIVFSMVSMVLISPCSIFFNKVVVPAIIYQMTSEEGVEFVDGGRVLLAEADDQPTRRAPGRAAAAVAASSRAKKTIV